MANIKYYLSGPGNIHLKDSYKYAKKEFDGQLRKIEALHPTCEVFLRKRWSLKFEWLVHNVFYRWNIKRERTADCDLNYPQKWYVNWAYNILGCIFWPFAK